MITNPEHINILLADPLDILPSLLKGKTFNHWHDKAYYLRDNISQEIIISSYLIISDCIRKFKNNSETNPLLDRYLDDLDVFYLGLTDENAAKMELRIVN